MVTDDSQDTAELQALLSARIGRDRYALWFGKHTKFTLHEQRLVVLADTVFVRDCLRRNFARDVAECGKAYAGCEILVEFEAEVDGASTAVCEAPTGDEQLELSNGSVNPVELEEPTQEAATIVEDLLGVADGSTGVLKQTSFLPDEPVAADSSKGRRKRRSSAANVAAAARVGGEPTLASFVVGKCNEYAYAAAQMNVRGLQQASPVLLYGPTGTGKTHLLRSIRAEYRNRHSRARAIYLTAEQFTTSFVEALRGTGIASFRQKCRGADLLLIDDVQFFAGKRASLEELLHTLDAVATEGKSLVLASDRGPAALRSLGHELVSRLAGGLACEILPPNYETRLGIVRSWCQEMRIDVSEEVRAMVASQITMGARELRGALHRLSAMSIAFEQPISPALAATALAELAQQCTRPVKLADVENAVCNVFGVERSDLRSERKGRSINEPRMLAMWLARKYTRAPWSEIGQFFGRRSHSTVISAHKRVEQLIRTQAAIGVSDQSCGVEEAIRRVEAALRTA